MTIAVKLAGIENVPENGVRINEKTLKDWAKQINNRGFDAPENEIEWVELIKDAVKKDQEFDE
ncbi:MAG: hypothetical protein ABIH24_02825 [Verrucomicrobiota bacterium]